MASGCRLNKFFMPTVKPNKTKEAIAKIFHNSSDGFGLKEFEGIAIDEVLYIVDRNDDKYYVQDLLTPDQYRVVYDDKKQKGRPEEIIRQLWLHKLRVGYQYPADRLAIEKPIHFGREIHTKKADIVVHKPDQVTPYIIVEVKSPKEEKGIEQLKSY